MAHFSILVNKSFRLCRLRDCLQAQLIRCLSAPIFFLSLTSESFTSQIPFPADNDKVKEKKRRALSFVCSRATIYNTWGDTCLASTASEDDIIGMFALKTRLSAEINKEQSRFRTSLEKRFPHQVLSIYPSFSSLHFFANSGPESFSPLENSYERQFNHIHCRTFIYYKFLLFIVAIVTLHFFWLVRHQFLPQTSMCVNVP